MYGSAVLQLVVIEKMDFKVFFIELISESSKACHFLLKKNKNFSRIALRKFLKINSKKFIRIDPSSFLGFFVNPAPGPELPVL